METENETEKVMDITPSWMTILNAVKEGIVEVSALEKPCRLADRVLDAKTNGKKSITFSFNKDGTIDIEVV